MTQIHIIDGQQDLILDYITAKHIISDDHKKSLEETLETYNFITLADRRFSEYLEKRNRIVIPDEDNTLREFVVFESAKYKDTEGYKAQVFTNASYLELKKSSIIRPGSFTGTASQHLGFGLNNTGWKPGIVEVSGKLKLDRDDFTNPYEYIKRLKNEFGGETRFRIEHDGNKITDRYVDLLERVGQWRGREVEFGKDLDGIRRIEKQDIVTALLGLGPEDENGQRLEVLVEDDGALQRWGRIDEYGNLNHLIEPYEIESSRTEMTEEEARQYTRAALDKRIDTQVTYETTIVDLEAVPGMHNKKIRFGDTIKIKDTKFNPPLFLEARIFEQIRSIKSKAKKDIKLGDFIEYTEEQVNAIWKQLQKQIQNRVSRYEMAEYTYDRLTIDHKDEIVFDEGKTFAEAVGIDAKEYADGQDGIVQTELRDYANGVADSALDQAKMYAVAQEVYDNKMQQIADDLADRTTIEYVDGQLVDKANVGDVYTIEDVDNMINNTVSVIQYETDMEGIVTDLQSQGTRIGQNETAIGLRATTEDLNAVEGTLYTAIGNVDVKADGIIQSVESLESDLDGQVEALEGSISTLAGEVELKASQSIVDSLESRVETAESTLSILPDQIESKVDDGEARSIFLQEASSFTFDADQIIFDGHVFGGNATFTGDISGATITGSEIVSVGDTGRITMDNANLNGQWYYSFNNINYTFNLTPFEFSLVEYTGNNSSPNNMVGRTDIGSLGVFFDRGNGGSGSITFQGYQGTNADETVMTLTADTVRSDSFAAIGTGVNRGFKFSNNHVISTGTNLHFTMFGNRAGGGYPFRIRSHVNFSSYRDDFWIGADGVFYSTPLYNNTSSNPSNARVSYADGDQNKGSIFRSVSAKKYKTDIQTVTDVDYYKILKLNLSSWLDKGDIERNGGSTDGVKRNYGLIADEVAEVGLPQYVDYMEGEIEGLAYDRLSTLLIPITKDHEIKLSTHEVMIIALENKVEILENEIKELKGVA